MAVERRFTVALTRGEFANLYHTVAEWYNVYLLTQFFAVTEPPHVLMIDAHPAASLDDAWNVLFTGHRRHL